MRPGSLLLLLVLSPLALSSSEPPLLALLDSSPLALHLLRLLHRRDSPPLSSASFPSPRSPTPEDGDTSDHDDVRVSRRDEPPLSIDLTFHLLRNMIHMAKVESQREQALLNRKVLDEVGK